MFHLVSSSSVSVLRVHSLAVCCTVHLIIWEKQQQVFASFPRVRSAANKAAGSSCPQGSRFSAGIGLCRSLWRVLAAAAEVADSSSSKSVCLRRGEHPAERAGSGLWVGTPDPVDLSSLRWAPPHSSRLRQLSQRAEGSHIDIPHSLEPRKNPTGIFHNIPYNILQ